MNAQAKLTVHSKAVVLLLFNCCLVCFPLLVVRVLCLSLFRYALLCVLSSFAFILKRKIFLVALLLLSYGCLVTEKLLRFFLTVSWVGLRYFLIILSYFFTLN